MMCLTSDCTEGRPICRRNDCGLCWLFTVSKTVEAQWKKLKLNCQSERAACLVEGLNRNDLRETQTTIGRSGVGRPEIWSIDRFGDLTLVDQKRFPGIQDGRRRECNQCYVKPYYESLKVKDE